jgi:hypothetical protein
VAKTVAELASYLDILSNRFEAAADEIAQLWAENERLREQNHQASVEAAKQREELAHLRKAQEELRTASRDQDRTTAELRQELALVRQRLDDHLTRVELWDSRRWGFIFAIAVALFSASATFTSGLIIASFRK